MYKNYQDKKPLDTKRYIWNTPIRLGDGIYHPRIDLVPCDIDLIGEDISPGQIASEFSSMQALQKNADQYIRDRSFLARAINEVRAQYDYVLIDCPPNLYLMTENALVASDYYIVTAIPDHLSTIGLNILIGKVEKIEERVKRVTTLASRQANDPGVAEFGAILFVRVRIGGSMLTAAHDVIMRSVRTNFGTDKCFKAHTTELIGYTEAAVNNLPVWLHNSENAKRAADKQEYPEIAKELLEKF